MVQNVMGKCPICGCLYPFFDGVCPNVGVIMKSKGLGRGLDKPDDECNSYELLHKRFRMRQNQENVSHVHLNDVWTACDECDDAKCNVRGKFDLNYRQSGGKCRTKQNCDPKMVEMSRLALEKGRRIRSMLYQSDPEYAKNWRDNLAMMRKIQGKMAEEDPEYARMLNENLRKAREASIKAKEYLRENDP